MAKLPRAVWFCVLGLASAGALGALGALGLIYSGLYDASASAPHDRVTGWATHAAMVHYVRRAAVGLKAPPTFTAAQVEAGRQEYEASCLACHGGPGVAQAKWVSALTPPPPYLLSSARRWTAPQLFVIVHDGLKMTAMPAWGEFMSDQQTWNVVAFLEVLPETSAADYARRRAAAPAQAGVGSARRVPPSSR